MTGNGNDGMELREKKGEHPAGDAGQLTLLGLFLVVWVLDSFFLHWTTSPAAYLPLLWRLVFAGIFLLLGLALARAAHTVTDHEDGPEEVMKSGVFRYVRHPLYLGALLFYVALTAATCSLASLGMLLVIFIFYNYIAGYEEKLMLRRFGDEYGDYMKKTGKWIPGTGRG
jgi:protein-S-isoprenylcysteine O-methyltransferase Ste14